MRIRSHYILPIFLLTTTGLLVGCGDPVNPNTGAGGSGASGGNGGAGGEGGGGSSIQIEKPENAIEGQYIFILDDTKVTPEMAKTVAEELLAPHQGVLLQVYDGSLFGFAANNLDDAKAVAMTKDGRITRIGQDCVVEPQTVQSNAPWNLDRIDTQALSLDTNYTYNYTGKGVHAYVIDTGIRASHVELVGKVSGGISFINDGKGTNGDQSGHGTGAASVIAGVTAGVAKDALLHPVRVAMSASDVIAGVDWVTKNHVKPAVATITLTAPVFSLLDDAVAASVASGVTYVVAAGNQYTDACKYSPGRVPAVINVGAVTKQDGIASFSNFGTCIDIFAPGVEVTIAHPLNDGFIAATTGTSGAAPHVAGVAALYLEQNPNATPAEVTAAVLAGASSSLVGNIKGSPNKLVYSRFMEPKTGFVDTKPWDTYYTNGGLWLNANQGSTIQYADINGDKKMDVCGRAANGIVCEISDGTTFSGPQVWEPGYSDVSGWGAVDNVYGTIRFPDLNGDGKADVCGRGPGGIYCGLSDGTKFVPSGGTWDSAFFTDVNGWNNPVFWTTLQFPDINGDGKADICGRQTAGVVCALSTGTAFGTPQLWEPGYNDGVGWAGSPNLYGTIRFPDLNGDGKADVCGRSNSGLSCGLSDGTKFVPGGLVDNGYFADVANWNNDVYWRTIQYADVNGDKKDDVCGRGVTGMVCLLSQGDKFGPGSTWAAGFSDGNGWNVTPSLWATVRLADLNGDGKADVCGRWAQGISCAISTGTHFTFDALWDSTFSDVAGWAAQDYYWGTIRFPDVNGDGKADVCGRSQNGITCGTATP